MVKRYFKGDCIELLHEINFWISLLTVPILFVRESWKVRVVEVSKRVEKDRDVWRPINRGKRDIDTMPVSSIENLFIDDLRNRLSYNLQTNKDNND